MRSAASQAESARIDRREMLPLFRDDRRGDHESRAAAAREQRIRLQHGLLEAGHWKLVERKDQGLRLLPL